MKKTLYCLMLSSLGLTTACVDDSYDLSKDIDMTVTVGGDLTTPGNSSEDITLEDLLDIDTLNSDLKLDTLGNYRLEMNGDPTNSKVSVSNVTIDATTPEQPNASDEIKFDLSKWNDNNARTATIEGLTPSMELDSDVPEDVVDLENATIDGSGRIVLKLDIQGDAKRVTLKKGLKLVFPDYITVKSNSSDFVKENNTNTLVFQRDNYTIEKNVGAQWSFEIEKIYFKEGQNGVPAGQGFKNGTIYFDINVPIQGNVIVNKSDLSSSTGEVGFQLVGKVSSQTMNLGQVKAQVDPVIDFNVADVVIKNLPDFLTENDVTADLYNPQIYLEVNNQTPVEVNLKANLLAIKKGEDTKSVSLGTSRDTYIPQTSIRLKPGKENILCLCPHPEEIKTNSNDTVFIKVDNLPDLIKTIPDTIRVQVGERSAQVMQKNFDSNGNNLGAKFYEIYVGKDFNVTTDYTIKAPLEFGNEFKIAYNDTINGWSEDIEDFEMKEVEVTLNAVNAIPLNLNLSAKAIDVQGNEMQDVEVTVKDPNKNENEETYIMAGSLNGKKTTSLVITLRSKDGVSRIKNLDGLIISLKGSADPTNEERILNRNQTLKLDDLKLHVKGGVTVDLN